MAKWMMDPDTKNISWTKIGVSVNYAKVNGCASRSQDG